MDQGLVIGIDAANIRLGGGITHLTQILSHVTPESMGIDRVVVWGGKNLLDRIPSYHWLEKKHSPLLEGGILKRTFWQVFYLSGEARKNKCSVIFVPGASYFGSFRPVVTMNQNLIPFEPAELNQYRFSINYLKFLLLRFTQSVGFLRSDGIIFLTSYAKRVVIGAIGELPGEMQVIPHGVDSEFNMKGRTQNSIDAYSDTNPYRILYVSNIDLYKHQNNVVEALFQLRKKGFPLALKLVGPATEMGLKSLNLSLDKYDPERKWVVYEGAIEKNDLIGHYSISDLAIFASSCETFGITLLEYMSAGIPIACSSLSSMSETLKDGGVYFNPYNIDEIESAILELMSSASLRMSLQLRSKDIVAGFTWKKTADLTFSFIKTIAKR